MLSISVKFIKCTSLINTYLYKSDIHSVEVREFMAGGFNLLVKTFNPLVSTSSINTAEQPFEIIYE